MVIIINIYLNIGEKDKKICILLILDKDKDLEKYVDILTNL